LLAGVKFSDIHLVALMNFISHCSLPFEKGVTSSIALHAVLSSIHKSSCKLDSLDVVEPSLPAVFQTSVSSHHDHPVLTLHDKLSSFVLFGALSVLDKASSKAASCDDLLEPRETSVDVFDFASSFNPVVETLLHAVAVEHVYNMV
jgi:hypothetical protein